MNCIFCHKVSDNSKSIEHIVPESLGNKEHILWNGAVCGECNNYFATKIEKELLEQPYFVSVRHRNFIKTKRNHLVPIKVPSPHSENGFEYVWMYMDENAVRLGFENESKIIPLIASGQKKHMIVPIFPEPQLSNYILSRFLAKCAFEYLTLTFDNKEGIDRNLIGDFLKEKQFDNIRKYARYGEGTKFWKYNQRRIYGEDARFVDKNENNGLSYEVLHEMCLFVDESTISKSNHELYAEIYFVLVIMGIEYVINMGGNEIASYENWLKKNNYISPIIRDYEKRVSCLNSNTFSLQITENIHKKLNDERWQ